MSKDAHPNSIKDLDMTKKVTFVVNEIPEHINRTRYQHAEALTGAFDTTIISKGPIPSSIRQSASRHSCFNNHPLSFISAIYPLWLFYTVFRIECSTIVTGQHGLFLMAGRAMGTARGQTWIADIWDDPALTVESYRNGNNIKFSPRFFYHRLLLYLSSITLAGADKVITSIHPDVLKKYAIDEQRIVKLSNGVSSEFLGESVSLNTNDEIKIIYVGHVNKKRNVHLYTDFLSTVNTEQQLVVDLVGPTDDEVRQQIATEDGSAKFNIHGTVPHETVIQLINKADICLCILPECIENYRYSYPIKLFEYAAAGKAIVASDFTGISQILTDGVDAILVDPTNTEEVAEAIQNLIQNPQMRLDLGKNARDTAEEYTWKKLNDRYVECINTV